MLHVCCTCVARVLHVCCTYVARAQIRGPAWPGPGWPGPGPWPPRLGPARHSSARSSLARLGPARLGLALACSAGPSGLARPGAARRSPAQPGLARPGAARPGAVQPSPARHSPARLGPALGLARPGCARDLWCVFRPGQRRPVAHVTFARRPDSGRKCRVTALALTTLPHLGRRNSQNVYAFSEPFSTGGFGPHVLKCRAEMPDGYQSLCSGAPIPVDRAAMLCKLSRPDPPSRSSEDKLCRLR